MTDGGSVNVSLQDIVGNPPPRRVKVVSQILGAKAMPCHSKSKSRSSSERRKRKGKMMRLGQTEFVALASRLMQLPGTVGERFRKASEAVGWRLNHGGASAAQWRDMPHAQRLSVLAEAAQALPANVIRMASAPNPWVVYRGPRGGKGWKHSITGDIRYGGDRPGAGETGGDAKEETPSQLHGPHEKRLKGKPREEMTQAQFSAGLNDLLDSPEKYGISDADADRLEQAVVAIHGAVNGKKASADLKAWWAGLKPHEKLDTIDDLWTGGYKTKAEFTQALARHHAELTKPEEPAEPEVPPAEPTEEKPVSLQDAAKASSEAREKWNHYSTIKAQLDSGKLTLRQAIDQAKVYSDGENAKSKKDIAALADKAKHDMVVADEAYKKASKAEPAPAEPQPESKAEESKATEIKPHPGRAIASVRKTAGMVRSPNGPMQNEYRVTFADDKWGQSVYAMTPTEAAAKAMRSRLAQERQEQATEQLRGGKADARLDSDFDPDELAVGITTELEHTKDRAQAKEIAKDHLAEDPDYYQKLAKVEGKPEPSEPAEPTATAEVSSRVEVRGDIYAKSETGWRNETNPAYNASDETMQRWRDRGIVKEVKEPSDGGKLLDRTGGEGAGGGLHAGEPLGEDEGTVSAGQPAEAGSTTGGEGGVPGLSDVPRVGSPAVSGAAGERGDAILDSRGASVSASLPGTELDQPQTADVQAVLSKPPTPEHPTDLSAGNWRYHTRDFASGGLKTKFRNNIAALRTIQAMRVEGRDKATPEEQAVLSKWVGWGQFPGVFNDFPKHTYPNMYRSDDDRAREELQKEIDPEFDKRAWQKEHEELRELLTDEEWESAKKSTMNAHFTHPEIVDAHWKMAQKLGFNGGRFLETSAGVGYYLGQMPSELSSRTHTAAVELESSTGAMLKALYPATRVEVQGFQDYQSPDNFYDLVASNVPFGDYGIHDPRYNKYDAPIHDYFFLKSADLAKPGGLVMHITSTGTLDKPDDAVRRKLAETCDLVAAYRMPGDTHKENAGTSVVTDMLILRKRLPGEKPVDETETPPEAEPKQPGFTGITTDSLGRLYHWKDGKRVPGPDWMGLKAIPDPDGGDDIHVNAYWSQHPENILGRLDRSGTMYSGEEKGVSLATPEELSDALGRQVRVEIDPESKKRRFVFDDTGEKVPPAVIREAGKKLFDARLQAAIDRLPEGAFKPQQGSKAAFEPDRMPAPGDVRDGGFAIRDGKLYQRNGGALEEVKRFRKRNLKELSAALGGNVEKVMLEINPVTKEPFKKPQNVVMINKDGVLSAVPLETVNAEVVNVPIKQDEINRIAGMLGIRDAARSIINKERMDQDATEERKTLNEAYDAYVEKFGPLNDARNTRVMQGDPDSHLLKALEKWDAKESTAKKADMFSKRTVGGDIAITKADNVSDGLGASLHASGGVNVDHIAKLTGKTPDEVAFELVDKGLAFEDPQEGWKQADLYLSGNVRRKLLMAKAAAEVDPKFRPNVAALEKVQPEDVDYSLITPKMGAPWIPPQDIQEFAKELLNANGHPIEVHYVPETGEWRVGWSKDGAKLYKGRDQATEVWGVKQGGTVYADAMDCIKAALTGKSITCKGGMDRFTDAEGVEHEFRAENEEGEDVVNKALTADVAAKVQEIKDRFKEWLWEDDARTERLARIYNDNFNNIRDIDYDGQHLTLPGMDPAKAADTHPHIKDFVWQVVTTGGGLAAHEVGIGKTRAMIASAMELRRLGLAKKPCIACLKANIEQITKEVLDTYPAAKILSTAGLYDAKKRQDTIARMATGDYDIILMTHDQLNKLKMSPEVEAKYIKEELAELEAAKKSAEAEMESETSGYGRRKKKGSDKKVKALEKAKAALEKRLQDALAVEKKDRAMSFDELGCDMLMVDECFPGDTVVETERGQMTIGEIVDNQLPVKVLSCNRETGGMEYKDVTAWFKRPLHNHLVRVTHERGSFVCTPNHNIWSVEDADYVGAGNLSPFHTLRLTNGPNGDPAHSKVLGVTPYQQLGDKQTADGGDAVEWTYDIEVDGTHNYFADGVNVSNSHMYKSLPVYTKMDRVKGIPTNRSQRATTMFMRTRWLQEQNGGRGVVFATGTPISNTMAELFTMQKYLQYNELKERGVHHFDAWCNTFGEITHKPEFTVTGEYKPATRLSAFTNIPELLHISRSMMDVVRADDVKRLNPATGEMENVIKRPNRKDHSIVSRVDSMPALMQDLVKRAKAMSQRGGPAEKGQDNMLVICTDGRKGAVDMRLLDDNAPDDPNSKTNLCVNKVLELQKARPDQAQIIFCDLGVHESAGSKHTGMHFGEGEELVGPEEAEADDEKDDLAKVQTGEDFAAADLGARGKFRLYEDVIQKLVKGGISREQIADFSQLTGEDKIKAMAMMRTGEIKVAIGSTQKLGTGCNVQDRLMAMHHLDVPWVPASVEQRDGRGWRHGNTNKEVGIYRYVAEGSLDQKFWDIISKKAGFQDQVLRNRESNIRTVKDDDTEVLTADQLMAIASGDTRQMDRVNLEEEVKTLQAAAGRHEREQARLKKSIAKLETEVPAMEEAVGQYEQDIKHLEAHPDFEWVTPEVPEVEGEEKYYLGQGWRTEPGTPAVPPQTHTKRSDAEKAFDERLDAVKKQVSEMSDYDRRYRAKPIPLGEYRGLKVFYDSTNNGGTATTPVYIEGASGAKHSASPSLKSVEYVARDLPVRHKTRQEFLEGGKKQLEAAQKNLGKKFDKSKELKEKQEKLQQLNEDLGLVKKRPEKAPKPETAATKPPPPAPPPSPPPRPVPAPTLPPSATEPPRPTVHVLSGKTYDNREAIKSLGGRWDGVRKVWTIKPASDDAGRERQRKAFDQLSRKGVRITGHEAIAMSLDDRVAGYDDQPAGTIGQDGFVQLAAKLMQLPGPMGDAIRMASEGIGWRLERGGRAAKRWLRMPHARRLSLLVQTARSMPIRMAAPVRMGSEANPWQPYKGPRGGKGWKHSGTGDIRYGGDRPGANETGSGGKETPSPFV